MYTHYSNDKVTGTALKKVVLKFLPNHLTKNVNLSQLGYDTPAVLPDNGVELIKKLMKHTTDDIRFYGTAEQIANDLRSYRSFPSNHTFFGIDITEEYNYDPEFWTSQSGDSFISKQDLLVRLYSCLRSQILLMTHQSIMRSITSIFLKTCEKKLNECCEFVRFHKDTFENFENLKRKIELFGYSTDYSPSSSTFDEIFNEWKSWIPGWTDEQYEPIRIALQTFFEQVPESKKDGMYGPIASACRCVLDLLQKTMDSNPEYFLPTTPATIKVSLITVRVFSMGNNKMVVMKSELFKAFKVISGGSDEWNYEDSDGYVQTMDLYEVERQYGNMVSKVEFIHRQVLTSEAIPLMTPTGNYCIPYSQGSNQIFSHLTMVLKIFQKVKKDSWHLVLEYMEWLEGELNASGIIAEFITVGKLDYIVKYTDDFFKEFENVPTKSIRNVRNIGFNLNDLRKELKYLGLVDALPDILVFSKQAFDLTVSRKDGRFLCTQALICAVGQCQKYCVKHLFPKVFGENFRSGNDNMMLEKDGSQPAEAELKTFVQEAEKTKEPESVVSVECCSRTCSEGLFDSSDYVDGEDKKDSVIDELRSKMKSFIETNVGLHKTCKKNQTEIDSLKEENANLKNALNDYESLKSKFSKCEKNEAKTKEQNKKLNESNQQLTRLVATLKSQLKTEQQKSKKVEEECQQKEVDFDRQMNVLEKNATNSLEALAEIEKKYKAITARVDRLVASESESEKRIADLDLRHSEDSFVIERMTQEATEYREQLEMLQLDISIKISAFEDKITESEQIIIGLTDSRNQMTERNEQLKSLLEKERQRTQELALTMAPMLQRMAGGKIDVDMEQEISEIKNVNRELRNSNIRLSERIEEQSRTIKSFFDQVGQIQKSYSSSSCQTTPEEFTCGYTGVKHHLWSLQKIKDSFRNGKQLKQAKEMVEKLSKQPEIQEMATYELQQYEAQLHHYLQSIEVNIQKIKKTGECTQLDPIPDFPTFSDRFLKEYWKQIDDKNSRTEIPESSPEDLECLICLIEMTPEEKTMKCDHCRKVLHSMCASEWLKRHRSCPHCRRELLDPTEFPPLS